MLDADGRGLGRDARLRLFVRICEGVAHAHRRGVIHRDLKPENILVDGDGHPRILDFGIARATEHDSTTLTQAGEIIGTLSYMSPEQLLGDPDSIDLRTDVYSLGVILFRLLIGTAPVDLDGLSVPQAAVRLAKIKPARLGRSDKSLKGDLQTVVATALEHDLERRYSSVDQFADDVTRVLDGQPITARPATTAYQVALFTRKHKALVATAVLAVLALIAAVVGTSAGLIRSERALARAEVDRDRARRTNRFVDRMLSSASPDELGRETRVVDILRNAGFELDADQGLDASVRGALHLTLGRTYGQLGLLDDARRHLEDSLGAFLLASDESHEGPLEARAALCDLLVDMGELDTARLEAERVKLAVAQLDDPPLWLAIRPLELECNLSWSVSDRQATVDLHRQLVAAWDEHKATDFSSWDTARNNLAVALSSADQIEEAEAVYRASLSDRERIYGADHPITLRLRANYAMVLDGLGRSEEAANQLEGLMPLAFETWGEEHNQVLVMRANLATVLMNLNRLEEATLILDEVVATYAQQLGMNHPTLVNARSNLSVAALQAGQPGRALEALEELVHGMEADPNANTIELLVVQGNRASALEKLERLDEAAAVGVDILSGMEEEMGESHFQTIVQRNNQALRLMKLGQHGSAVELAKKNLQLAVERMPDHPTNNFPFRMNLGRTLAGAGRFEEAEVELLAVHNVMIADPDTPSTNLARIAEVLAETYTAWGKTERAEHWRK